MPDADLPILDDAACQRALAILVDVGTALAQELKIPSKDITLAARTAAFARVSEAVRRNITLSRHITASPVEAVSAVTKRTLARKQVIRAVDESIETNADPAEAPVLRIELLERLDAPEFDADLTHRPRGELILELCRDLGLANVPGLRHFPRRTPDDIAILCAQAAAPAGSGLPQWLAAAAPQAAINDTEPTIRLKEH